MGFVLQDWPDGVIVILKVDLRLEDTSISSLANNASAGRWPLHAAVPRDPGSLARRLIMLLECMQFSSP